MATHVKLMETCCTFSVSKDRQPFYVWYSSKLIYYSLGLNVLSRALLQGISHVSCYNTMKTSCYTKTNISGFKKSLAAIYKMHFSV